MKAMEDTEVIYHTADGLMGMLHLYVYMHVFCMLCKCMNVLTLVPSWLWGTCAIPSLAHSTDIASCMNTRWLPQKLSHACMYTLLVVEAIASRSVGCIYTLDSSACNAHVDMGIISESQSRNTPSVHSFSEHAYSIWYIHQLCWYRLSAHATHTTCTSLTTYTTICFILIYILFMMLWWDSW